MLTNQSSQLWVTSSNLLQDRLEHLRILLDDLSQLLELRVISEEIEVAKSSAGGASCACTSSSSSKQVSRSTYSGTTTGTTSLSSLGSLLEEVDGLITTFSAWIWGGNCGSCGGGSSSGSSGGLSLFLLEVLGDALVDTLTDVNNIRRFDLQSKGTQ